MGRESSAAERVADVAVAVLRAGSEAEAMRCVTDALVRAVGADNALYHEFAWDGWGLIHGTSPVDVWDALPFRGAPTAELRQVHPGVDVMCRAPGHQPFALTEVVSERAWRSFAFNDALRPAFGKALKLHIGVAGGPGVSRGWSLTRDGADYSRADLEVAQALQPVLTVVAQRYSLALRPPQGPEPLTGRERVVLAHLAEGATAAAVGRRLGISGRTVSKHLERVYRKLGVQDRVSAVRRATELGLLHGAACPPHGAAPPPRRAPEQEPARHVAGVLATPLF